MGVGTLEASNHLLLSPVHFPSPEREAEERVEEGGVYAVSSVSAATKRIPSNTLLNS